MQHSLGFSTDPWGMQFQTLHTPAGFRGAIVAQSAAARTPRCKTTSPHSLQIPKQLRVCQAPTSNTLREGDEGIQNRCFALSWGVEGCAALSRDTRAHCKHCCNLRPGVFSHTGWIPTDACTGVPEASFLPDVMGSFKGSLQLKSLSQWLGFH